MQKSATIHQHLRTSQLSHARLHRVGGRRVTDGPNSLRTGPRKAEPAFEGAPLFVRHKWIYSRLDLSKNAGAHLENVAWLRGVVKQTPISCPELFKAGVGWFVVPFLARRLVRDP